MEKINNSPSGEEQKAAAEMAKIEKTQQNPDAKEKAEVKAKAVETEKEKTAIKIEKAEKTEKAKSPSKSKFETDVERIAKNYAPHYPNVQSLHFTSDKMVFLEQDLAQAQAHQLQLGDGEVLTVKINQQ